MIGARPFGIARYARSTCCRNTRHRATRGVRDPTCGDPRLGSRTRACRLAAGGRYGGCAGGCRIPRSARQRPDRADHLPQDVEIREHASGRSEPRRRVLAPLADARPIDTLRLGGGTVTLDGDVDVLAIRIETTEPDREIEVPRDAAGRLGRGDAARDHPAGMAAALWFDHPVRLPRGARVTILAASGEGTPIVSAVMDVVQPR